MRFSKETFIFLLTSLIAGTGWVFLPYQFEELSIGYSLSLRFFLTSLVLFLYIWLTKRKFHFSLAPKVHFIAAFQGLLMYSLTYVLIYKATTHLPTGLISILISLIIIPSMLFERAMFKAKISQKFLVGVILGVIGTFLLYIDTLDFKLNDPKNGLISLLYVIISLTCSGFSSNITKLIRKRTNYANIDMAAYAMLYGAVYSLIYGFCSGDSLVIPTQPMFYVSLAYLVLIIGPGVLLSYLWLIEHIGPSKASLIWIISPVIALNLSIVFEGMAWTKFTLIGTFLVLLGSYLATQKPKRVPIA